MCTCNEWYGLVVWVICDGVSRYLYPGLGAYHTAETVNNQISTFSHIK